MDTIDNEYRIDVRLVVTLTINEWDLPSSRVASCTIVTIECWRCCVRCHFFIVGLSAQSRPKFAGRRYCKSIIFLRHTPQQWHGIRIQSKKNTVINTTGVNRNIATTIPWVRTTMTKIRTRYFLYPPDHHDQRSHSNDCRKKAKTSNLIGNIWKSWSEVRMIWFIVWCSLYWQAT